MEYNSKIILIYINIYFSILIRYQTKYQLNKKKQQKTKKNLYNCK